MINDHLFASAIALHNQGQLDEAEKSYKALTLSTNHQANAIYLLGVLYNQKKYFYLATVFLEQSVRHCKTNPEIFHTLGLAHYELRNYARAREAFSEAVKLSPTMASLRMSLGNALLAQRELKTAISEYNHALQLDRNNLDAYNNLGNAYRLAKEYDKAEAYYLKASEIQPSYWHAYNNLGVCLLEQSKFTEAIRVLKQGMSVRSDRVELVENLASVYRKMGIREEAKKLYEQALRIDPDNFNVNKNYAQLLRTLADYPQAAARLEKLLELRPLEEGLQGDLLNSKMAMCDWQGQPEVLARVIYGVRHCHPVVMPFHIISVVDDPELHLEVARQYVGRRYPDRAGVSGLSAGDSGVGRRAKGPGERIRLGYFSADFQVHPVSQLIAGVFEHHDKSRFEVIGFSYGPNKQDVMRQRLLKAFDQFIDVREKSDQEVAAMTRAMGLDIAIDLSGYTFGARTGIFAERCAPVQINYLGYPGTMGASYYDYIIADGVIIPPSHERYYSEKVLRLAHCYQPNDRVSRQIASRVFSRQEMGLPQDGFVFCCFNNNYKILPETFDSWMRIVKAVPGSVLWLLADTTKASENLKKEAAARGVEPERVVFAPRMELPEHLARHSLADLFLDTFPYNAHTTASDALWTGLPVLTRMGESFASRVAASILWALGLQELITQCPDEFEQKAVALAKDPHTLAGLRKSIENNKHSQHLYDVEDLTFSLEAIFIPLLNNT